VPAPSLAEPRPWRSVRDRSPSCYRPPLPPTCNKTDPVGIRPGSGPRPIAAAHRDRSRLASPSTGPSAPPRLSPFSGTRGRSGTMVGAPRPPRGRRTGRGPPTESTPHARTVRRNCEGGLIRETAGPVQRRIPPLVLRGQSGEMRAGGTGCANTVPGACALKLREPGSPCGKRQHGVCAGALEGRPPVWSPGGAAVSSQGREPLDQATTSSTSPGGAAEAPTPGSVYRPSGAPCGAPVPAQRLTPLATDYRPFGALSG
jgi:hypothetical protein